jgi:hypothetical protein
MRRRMRTKEDTVSVLVVMWSPMKVSTINAPCGSFQSCSVDRKDLHQEILS